MREEEADRGGRVRGQGRGDQRSTGWQTGRTFPSPTPAPSGGFSPRRSGGSPRFGEVLGIRGAARAGGAGDRRSRRLPRDAAGAPARGERPPVGSPCGWWLLLLWSLPLASGELCAPLARGRLQCLQVSVFANRSWARTDGLARLGELQAYSWSDGSDAIRFLRPWARSGFSEPQWERLQQILRVYRRSFTRDVREFVKMLRLDCEPGVGPGHGGRSASPSETPSSRPRLWIPASARGAPHPRPRTLPPFLLPLVPHSFPGTLCPQ